MSKFHHTRLITDLSLKLEETFQAKFVTERELKFELDYFGVGRPGHMCDGVLEMEDKEIAIEVELTTKGKRRLAKIINGYLRNLEYAEVWYFCGNKEVQNLIESQAKHCDFIKTFLLSEWIEYNA